MKLTRKLPLLAFLLAVVTGCAVEAEEEESASTEDAIGAGVTRLATKLEDPDFLSAQGDNVYFATNHVDVPGIHHDLWVKAPQTPPRRLYANLSGNTSYVAASKHGIYSLDEDKKAIVRYPLDGSVPRGEIVLRHTVGSVLGGDMGIVRIATDDRGLAAALRVNEQTTTDIVVFAAGRNEKQLLRRIPYEVTALALGEGVVYVGTTSGELLALRRDGTDSYVRTLANAEGPVNDIVVDDYSRIVISSEKGIWMLNEGAYPRPRQLTNESAASLQIVDNDVLYVQPRRGVSVLRLALHLDPATREAAGPPRVVLKTRAPSSLVHNGRALFVTDKAPGNCLPLDEFHYRPPCKLAGSLIQAPY